MDEETEAIRLQAKQAQELDEADFAVGGAKKVASGKASAAPAVVERIQRNTEHLSKEEKLQLLSVGA